MTIEPLTPEGPAAPSRRLGWAGVALSIVGGLLAIGGLFIGIITGLGGNEPGAVVGSVLFSIGVAVLVAALGTATWQLVRRQGVALPVVTILLAFSPVLFVVGLRFAIGA